MSLVDNIAMLFIVPDGVALVQIVPRWSTFS
jgi:hypothetical protein